MPKRHDKITKSVNYDYYWDILFCTVPLLAVSCFYYGARPLLMMAAGLLTAYVADCVVTPLHAAGYRAHEPSSEAFAALIVLMMPASAPYYMVVTATIIAVLVKEAFGGEGHYPSTRRRWDWWRQRWHGRETCRPTRHRVQCWHFSAAPEWC